MDQELRIVVPSNLFYSSKIKSSLDLRAKREKAVGESIKALDDFKTRLQEEQKVIFFKNTRFISFLFP